ncbi:unnamed protein product [Urochloa humidicola]
MFLYGASRNARGMGSSFTAVSSRGGRDGFDFVCSELRDGLFVAASVNAAVGVACAIAAYVDIVRRRHNWMVTLGVALGVQACNRRTLWLPWLTRRLSLHAVATTAPSNLEGQLESDGLMAMYRHYIY